MARAGLALDVIGIVLVIIITYTVAVPVFGIDLSTLPGWAR
jgi:hypothetical protein